MKNIQQLDAKTINIKLSALVKFNEFLIYNRIQDNIAVTKQDFIKVQLNYASPAKIQKEDAKKFRQLKIKVLYRHIGFRNDRSADLEGIVPQNL